VLELELTVEVPLVAVPEFVVLVVVEAVELVAMSETTTDAVTATPRMLAIVMIVVATRFFLRGS
jgi:hypothetical protein